jgi:hypothetical protein
MSYVSATANEDRMKRRDFLVGMSAMLPAVTQSGDNSGNEAQAAEPDRGNISQSFRWGGIDEYVPLLLGNGDIGGLFDPFGGTEYDELRYGSGKNRDIRTLLLTQLMVPDYWVLEDQAAHFLDPKYYRPSLPRKYLTYGTPFTLLLRPQDAAFPERISDHKQVLDITQGTLRTQYALGEHTISIDTFISPDESVLVYCIVSTAHMRFQITPVQSPPRALSPDASVPSARYQRTKNGYAVNESEGDLIVLKNLSNVFCPSYVAVNAPGATREAADLHLPPGRNEIFVAIGHQSLGDPRRQAVSAVRNAARRGYKSLHARHVDWWRTFWEQSYISIPDARLQQMWHRSVYYLASCLPRRVKSFSPEGAYGVFPALAGYHPQDSTYHLFAALSSNHPDLCQAQMEYLLETLPVARLVAQQVYFLEGARYPWHSTPGLLPYLPGHLNDAYYLHEHHVNGWLVEFIRRYLDSANWNPDATRRYYPIIREIARFFSSMLSRRGEDFEITYVPSAGQEESGWDFNQKNLLDILVAAKWSLSVAADISERLKIDRDESARWKREAARISFSPCLRADGTYGSYEADEGHDEKVASQLIGVVMTPLFADYRAEFLQTYQRLRDQVDIRSCAWSPGYYAISAARFKKPAEALRSLNQAFEFSRPPWLFFVENTRQVPGRLPYYLAAHGLFVQAMNEMFLQDWSGKVELFPACPFPRAAFKLQAQGRVIEARIENGRIQVLSDVIRQPIPGFLSGTA